MTNNNLEKNYRFVVFDGNEVIKGESMTREEIARIGARAIFEGISASMKIENLGIPEDQEYELMKKLGIID